MADDGSIIASAPGAGNAGPVGGGTPNRARMLRQFAAATTRRTKVQMQDLLPRFVNADYAYWREIWRGIRHAMIGEVEIKRQGSTYLPRPESMDDDQWSAYLDRAVFYNMVYRTVTGLCGAIYRRDPRILNIGTKTKKALQRISKDGLSIEMFSKIVTQEMLSVGRYGILLDKAETSDPSIQPYLAGYTVENILDWTTGEIEGRTELDYVLLREFSIDRRLVVPEGTGVVSNPKYGQYLQRYRVLRLVQDGDNRWYYRQELYERDHADADLTEEPIISTPMMYGVPFRRIPFFFFNAMTSLPDIEKPPVLDILTLNLSHYRTYAQLEHGRFYTANPVYWVSGGNEDDDYHIGPSVVWQIEAGQQAGLIEFNGQGLKSLEVALSTKENQVAQLGGRLLGESMNAGQSDNQVKIKDRNEQSLLLNVTTVLNENFTALVKLLAAWLNEANEEIEFRVNQDFLLDNSSAREFRAVTMMYQAGIIPIDVLYEYFLRAEVIADYVDLDTFKNMLEDENQFPNDPNFAARKEGYADAKAKQAAETLDLQLAHEAEMQQDATVADAALQAAEHENKIDLIHEAPPPVPAAAVAANAVDPQKKPKAAKPGRVVNNNASPAVATPPKKKPAAKK